uniref:Uncharacterized protein n=2 Tax=Rhodnius prolixus TaxID=13249 RepID=T1HG43_RHOPR
MISIDDCYTCYCRAGKVFRCFDNPICGTEEQIFDEDGKCTVPGLKIRTRNYCKQCICNKDGTLSCHLNPEKCRICLPGKHFMPDGDCNICKCSDDGMSA